MEKKFLKVVSILWWVFLFLAAASMFVKGALNWWMWGASFFLVLVMQTAEMILRRRIRKKERERFEELIRESLNTKH